jgi:hypothetical protein
MKTQSYTRNLITSIMDADGSAIFNHDHKATIICFKDRLGMTANRIMAFKLEQIVQSCSALPYQKTELLCICAIPWISR